MPFSRRILGSKKSVPDLRPTARVFPFFIHSNISDATVPSPSPSVPASFDLNSPMSVMPASFAPFVAPESPSIAQASPVGLSRTGGGGFSKLFGWTRSPKLGAERGSNKSHGEKKPLPSPRFPGANLGSSANSKTGTPSSFDTASRPLVLSPPLAALSPVDCSRQTTAIHSIEFVPVQTTVVDDYLGVITAPNPPIRFAASAPSGSPRSTSTVSSAVLAQPPAPSPMWRGRSTSDIPSSCSSTTLSSLGSTESDRIWDSSSAITSYSTEGSSSSTSPPESPHKKGFGAQQEDAPPYPCKTAGSLPSAVHPAISITLPKVLAPAGPSHTPPKVIVHSATQDSLPFDPEFERAAAMECNGEDGVFEDAEGDSSLRDSEDIMTPKATFSSSSPATSLAGVFSQIAVNGMTPTMRVEGGNSSRIPTMFFENTHEVSLLSEVLNPADEAAPVDADVSQLPKEEAIDRVVGLGLCYDRPLTTPFPHEATCDAEESEARRMGDPESSLPFARVVIPPRRSSSIHTTKHHRTSSPTSSSFAEFMARQTERRLRNARARTDLDRSSQQAKNHPWPRDNTIASSPVMTLSPNFVLPSVEIVPPTPTADGGEFATIETPDVIDLGDLDSGASFSDEIVGAMAAVSSEGTISSTYSITSTPTCCSSPESASGGTSSSFTISRYVASSASSSSIRSYLFEAQLASEAVALAGEVDLAGTGIPEPATTILMAKGDGYSGLFDVAGALGELMITTQPCLDPDVGYIGEDQAVGGGIGVAL